MYVKTAETINVHSNSTPFTNSWIPVSIHAVCILEMGGNYSVFKLQSHAWPAWIFHDRNPKGQNLWFTMFKNLEWTTNLYYKKLLLMYIRQFRNLSYDIEKKII